MYIGSFGLSMARLLYEHKLEREELKLKLQNSMAFHHTV